MKLATHRALLEPPPTPTIGGGGAVISPASSLSSLNSTPLRGGATSAGGKPRLEYIDNEDEGVSSLERPVVRRGDHRPPVEGRDSFPRHNSDSYRRGL